MFAITIFFSYKLINKTKGTKTRPEFVGLN